MERLETEVLRLPGVKLRVHRFGGIEFAVGRGRELGHLHGHGLLDVLVGQPSAKRLLASRQVHCHHVFPRSGWISYQLDSSADVSFALELLAMALARGRTAVEQPDLV